MSDLLKGLNYIESAGTSLHRNTLQTTMSTLELYVFYCALALGAILSGHLLMQKYQQRKIDALTNAVAAAITGYFLQSHVRVAARCLAQPKEKHFLAFLDSEPHKRFRYSHIVEAVLIKHIEKTMDVHIDRVYWRFPLPEQREAGSHLVAPDTGAPSATTVAADAAAPENHEAQSGAEKSIRAQEDEYITQGLLRAKVRNDYLVDEGSWETFERAMQEGELSKSTEVSETADTDNTKIA